MKGFTSQASFFIIPTLEDARQTVYTDRKEAAQTVFSQIRTNVTIHKHIRKGHVFDFDVELDGRKDRVIVQHPRYGRVVFPTPIQLVAWILNEYI